MEGISGPVAPDPPASGPSTATKGGCLATCASGCATAGGLLLLVLTTGAGAAWEVVQPHHRATQSVPDGSCTFTWWRSALGGARYRITCDAKKDLTVEKFKLLSGPRGVELVESVEDWGQRPWEDQRPLSGEVITVDGGRSWTYDGTISLGTVPWVGPPATVTLTAVLDEQKRVFRADE